MRYFLKGFVGSNFDCPLWCEDIPGFSPLNVSDFPLLPSFVTSLKFLCRFSFFWGQTLCVTASVLRVLCGHSFTSQCSNLTTARLNSTPAL